MARLTAVGDSTPAWTSFTVSVSRVRQLAVAVRLHSIAAKVMYCTSFAGLACREGRRGRWQGDGREMAGRWQGDGREMRCRCRCRCRCKMQM